MTEPAWRQASDWRHRAWYFASLQVWHPGIPAFELAGGVGSDWWKVRHPNLLVGLAERDERVVLRYAALNWRWSATTAASTLATWAKQLVDVYAHLADAQPHGLAKLLRPVVVIDVGGHARVGFQPLAEGDRDIYDLPPDIQKRWPKCDESALVFAIGKALRERGTVDDTSLMTIVIRACETNPRRRFRTLADLARALDKIPSHLVVRDGKYLTAWESFERGAGWLELGEPKLALDCFYDALDDDRDLGVARTGAELAEHLLRGDQPPVLKPTRERLRGVDIPVAKPTGGRLQTPHMLWAHAEPAGLAFERLRDFRRALDVYRAVGADPRTNVALCTARARCHLALGDTIEAIEWAQRALAVDATYVGALELLVTGMLAKRWNEEALRNAEQLCDVAPTSARAHYLRGKALFANGRLPDARDAFERASELDPKLLEAQLLRREVERVTGNVKKSVGSQHAPTFDIPPQLAELRDVLLGGNTAAAIEALCAERYAADADAQLLLARLLVFDRQLDAAFEAYDRLVATSHRVPALVGKATALLELGKPGDALDIFTQLPDDADAAEGAARALEMLGRVDEAAAAYRRFIALASSGSELRVRAAELWLASR